MFPLRRSLSAFQRFSFSAFRSSAFTLIELLVVISIIIILMGLLFPAFKAAQDQAKRAQAKNDLSQIVTAVSAFYTEYGRYPTAATTDAAATFGPGGNANSQLFNELRAKSTTFNTRQIVFITPPDAKDQTTPRGGIKTSSGEYFDPWGTAYAIAVDANYDNQLTNPYGNDKGAGADPITQGVIAWSLGKDGARATNFTNSDDVISWQ